MENNITPIELLRLLFAFEPDVDDYQMVRMVFEECTANKSALDILKRVHLIPLYTEKKE